MAELHNPFIYGKVVAGEYYFSRKELCADLAKFIVSKQPVLILGPRRYGKTSFLVELRNYVSSRHKIETIFMDLFPITSHRDFLEALKLAISKCRGMSWWHRATTFIREHVPLLRPYLTLEPGGEVGFAVTGRELGEQEVKSQIVACLELVSKIGEGHKIAVFLDEFQQIDQMADSGWLERTLRTVIQNQSHVSYLYCGSRRSLLVDMFQNKARAFFQQATLRDFPRVPDAFADWMIARFKVAKIEINRDAVHHLLDVIGWSPNYAQLLGHHIVASGLKKIAAESIDLQLNRCIDLSGHTYINQYDSLPPTQKRLIKALANFPDASPYSEKIKSASHLSQGNVQSGLKALREKNLIDTESGGKGRIKITFDDPLFQKWLARTFPL